MLKMASLAVTWMPFLWCISGQTYSIILPREAYYSSQVFLAYRDVSTRNCVSKWCECEFEADSPSLHSPDRDFSSSIALHNWPVLD